MLLSNGGFGGAPKLKREASPAQPDTETAPAQGAWCGSSQRPSGRRRRRSSTKRPLRFAWGGNCSYPSPLVVLSSRRLLCSFQGFWGLRFWGRNGVPPILGVSPVLTHTHTHRERESVYDNPKALRTVPCGSKYSFW